MSSAVGTSIRPSRKRSGALPVAQRVTAAAAASPGNFLHQMHTGIVDCFQTSHSFPWRWLMVDLVGAVGHGGGREAPQASTVRSERPHGHVVGAVRKRLAEVL